jgi:hypothetical protein
MTRTLVAVGWLVSVGLSLGLFSCGTKDDATLSVYAQGLTITKSVNSFGAKAEGSVTVIFDLGHYSGAPVKVETIALSLFRDGKPMPTLTADVRFSPDTGEPNLPLDLNPGDKKSIRYKISGSSATEPLALTDAQATELCAGPVMVNGNVTMTGQAAPIAISAAPVSAACCP